MVEGTAASMVSQVGIFKEIFDKYQDNIPDYALVQQAFPFDKAVATGKKFTQAIRTHRSNSCTYFPASSTGTSFIPFNASKIERAEIQGSQIVMRDGITLEDMFSGDSDKKSVSNSTKLVAEGLGDDARFRIEVDCLHGQSANGLGVAVGAGAGNVVTIKPATFIPGLYFGQEEAQMDVFSSNLGTQRTGLGTDTIGSKFYLIDEVDLDAGTIKLDDDQNIAQDDVVFFRTQRTTGAYNTMPGIRSWLTATGTVANIDSALSVWKPSSLSASNGPLTFDLILKGCAQVSYRGQAGKMIAWVPATSWKDLMNDLAAAVRRVDNNVKKYTLGAESVEFHTGTGMVEVRVHQLMANGEAFVVPADGYKRVGACDLTYLREGDSVAATGSNGFYWSKVQGTDLYELDVFSHQTMYTAMRCRGFIITDIVSN